MRSAFVTLASLVSLVSLGTISCSSTGAGSDAAAAAVRVRGEEVTYSVDGVECRGYIAWDEASDEQRPGILVVHEWWGHNEYARSRARQLAEMGYTALAVDMYGDGKTASHPADAQKFMMEVMGDMRTATGRFLAAKTVLASHPSTDPTQTSAIGYCMGGGIVLQMAREGVDLDGVASFHGMLGTETPAAKDAIRARLLVAHGAADPFVPAEQVAAFEEEMKAAGADLRFVAYEDAKHGFTNPGATAKGQEFDLPLAYDERADHESWAELTRFLGELYPE